jgi:hypothetical protein
VFWTQYGIGCFKSWGVSGDVPFSGDYDGDGKADVAVYRGTGTRIFWIKRSTDDFGLGITDIAPPYPSINFPIDTGDVQNDGISDLMYVDTTLATQDPSYFTWYVRRFNVPGPGQITITAYSSGSQVKTDGSSVFSAAAQVLGNASEDLQILFRIRNTHQGTSCRIADLSSISCESPFGGNDLTNWTYLSADYGGPGSGLSDMVGWNRSTGFWLWALQGTYPSYTYGSMTWGQLGDVALTGDFLGDSKAELVVWRQSNGTWYIRDTVCLGCCPAYMTNGGSGGCYVQWGQVGDIPISSSGKGN